MTKNAQSFESAIKRLEEIVELLDNKDVQLEEALKIFEEGVKLVKFCSAKLDETKKKIEILVKKDGKMEPQPFEMKNEDEK